MTDLVTAVVFSVSLTVTANVGDAAECHVWFDPNSISTVFGAYKKIERPIDTTFTFVLPPEVVRQPNFANDLKWSCNVRK